eukprot:292354_1
MGISSMYLLSQIMDHFFKSDTNKCKLMNDEDYANTIHQILDNIFIHGGACRDLFLFEPINDIDITVNTQKLNKIHLFHLHKYHALGLNAGTNESRTCCLWNRYLNKLSNHRFRGNSNGLKL